MILGRCFRCIICMLHYKDSIICVDRKQAELHIYRDHDYVEKLRVARFVGIVDEDEKRSAAWLAASLAELSFVQDVSD